MNMTKETKANVTVNLERITPEYLYPNLFTDDDMSQVKIPTIAELSFLGTNNILSLKEYYRHEEKKFKKMLKRISAELTDMSKETPETIKAKLSTDAQCDWCGSGYVTLYRADFENLSTKQLYEKSLQLSEKVHSCRFGAETAGWCPKNPWPCSTDLDCMKKSILPHQNRYPCPHYDVCFGAMPLQHENCIFSEVTAEMLNECRDYIQARLERCKAKLKFVAKYMHNINTAIKLSGNSNKPSIRYAGPGSPFIDDDGNCGFNAKMTPGERIVRISISDAQTITEGIFAGVVSDERKSLFMLFNMEDGTSDRYYGAINLRLKSAYMVKRSFEYLVDNPDYFEVWLRLADFTGKSAVTKAIVTARK